MGIGNGEGAALRAGFFRHCGREEGRCGVAGLRGLDRRAYRPPDGLKGNYETSTRWMAGTVIPFRFPIL